MILVTGGTGLVGVHLLMELCESVDLGIVAIYRSKDSLAHAKSVFLNYSPYKEATNKWKKIQWSKADITNVPVLIKVFESNAISNVYHCAGLVSFQTPDFEQLKKINIEGTANLVNLSIDYKVHKFCYVSSISTLNLNPNQSILEETSKWNSEQDNSGYAISKFGGEMEVWRGSEEGLIVVIVHPGVIVGKGFTTGSSAIFCSVKQGLSFYTTGVTGYVSAFDVAKAMNRLMQSKIKNDNFVLVSENISHKKVIDLIANIFRKKSPKWKVSEIVVRIISKLEAVFGLFTNRKSKIPYDMIGSLFSISTYSSNKIKKAIDFSFEPMDPVIVEVAKAFTSKD